MENTQQIVIIKLGRSIVTTDTDEMDIARFDSLAGQIKQLHAHNIGVVLVVSGAVVTGRKKITQQLSKSLYATVGQSYMMAELQSVFAKHGLLVGQMLLNKHDSIDRQIATDVVTVLKEGLAANIVMVLNENDAVELGSFDGNDYLAVAIAKLLQATHLVLLTDVAGVYDTHMQIIKQFSAKDLNSIADIKRENTKGQIGGMKAKIQAALDAKAAKINTVIADGKEESLLTRLLLKNEKIGTVMI